MSEPFAGGVPLSTSRRIAGVLGPGLAAVAATEAWNPHIWAGNLPPVVHFNGGVLFVAGLAIVQAHNVWTRRWPVTITLVGWFFMAGGLLRMAAPERYLEGVRNSTTTPVIVSALLACAVGLFLSVMAFARPKGASAPAPAR